MSPPEEHPRSLTRQLVVAGIVLGLLQVAIFALLIGAVRAADDANARTNDILTAVQGVSDLEKGVIDSETGMRGFVITGSERFLDPLNAARAALPDQERRIRADVKDGEGPLVDPLFADIDAYMSQWVDPVVAARRVSPARARQLVVQGEGKRRVDDIRAQFTAIRSGMVTSLKPEDSAPMFLPTDIPSSNNHALSCVQDARSTTRFHPISGQVSSMGNCPVPGNVKKTINYRR